MTNSAHRISGERPDTALIPAALDDGIPDARKTAFDSEFADWIAAENLRVADGIPGSDLRPW